MATTSITLTVYSKNGANLTPYSKEFVLTQLSDYVDKPDYPAYLTGNTLISYVETLEPYSEIEQYTVLETVSAISTLINDTNLYAEVDVVLTNAEIRAGNTTPISVIPSAGEGKIQSLDLNKCYFTYTYGGSAFTVNTNLVLVDSDSNEIAIATNAISGTSTKITRFVPTAGVSILDSDVFLQVKGGSPTFTAGTNTGTGKLHLAYSATTL